MGMVTINVINEMQKFHFCNLLHALYKYTCAFQDHLHIDCSGTSHIHFRKVARKAPYALGMPSGCTTSSSIWWLYTLSACGVLRGPPRSMSGKNNSGPRFPKLSHRRRRPDHLLFWLWKETIDCLVYDLLNVDFYRQQSVSSPCELSEIDDTWAPQLHWLRDFWSMQSSKTRAGIRLCKAPRKCRVNIRDERRPAFGRSKSEHRHKGSVTQRRIYCQAAREQVEPFVICSICSCSYIFQFPSSLLTQWNKSLPSFVWCTKFSADLDRSMAKYVAMFGHAVDSN